MNGKSMKHALYVQKGTSRAEVTAKNPSPIAIVELHLSESIRQLVSQ